MYMKNVTTQSKIRKRKTRKATDGFMASVVISEQMRQCISMCGGQMPEYGNLGPIGEVPDGLARLAKC